MSAKPAINSTLADRDSAAMEQLPTLHPLAVEQLKDATSKEGSVNVTRLITSVSSCYEASTRLACDQVGDVFLAPTVATRPDPQSETAFEAMVEAFEDATILIEYDGKIGAANKRAYEWLGRTDDDNCLPGMPIGGYLEKAGAGKAPQDWPSLVEAAAQTDGIYPLELALPNARSCALHLQRLTNGNHLLTLRSRQDYTDQKTHRLIENENRNLFDNAAIGIYRCDLDGRFMRANPAFVALLGYANEADALAKINTPEKPWHLDSGRSKTFRTTLLEHGRVTDFVSEVSCQLAQNRIWICENAWLVTDDDGQPLFYEGTIVGATDRIAAEAEIAHLAHHDNLTGLPNRLMFLKKLREALLSPNTASSVAVHCLDLDHFKNVNDTLGHEAGDRLLIAAARRLRSSIKSTDVLARLGGDEFTILQYGVRQPSDVSALASRIVSKMQEPFMIGDKQVNIGVSVGVATHRGQEPTGMLRDADIALYEAKRGGRRNHCVYTQAMGNAILGRRALEDDLREAIDKGEFELHLQPIVDAESGHAAVYEALLRWDHPTRGLVSPSRFVPIAEEGQMMRGLGDWVLNKVASIASHLPPGRCVAMNLSPLQLRDPGFIERLAASLEHHQVSPEQIELEMTETAIVTDDARTIESLSALRAMGLRLALDDFGTGHASLSYLQRFCFDKIKIDRSFVNRITEDPTSLAVVRAVTSLGRDLGADVVAEGVENAAQVAVLRDEGCQLFQGYLFGRPKAWQDVLRP